MKKNEHKKGSQLKLSSNEMKGLKKYKERYVEDVKNMFEAIKETVPYYTLEVYKEFVKMMSDYHTKYIQILGGTSFVKELVPVKKVINEASKYCAELEWGVSFIHVLLSLCVPVVVLQVERSDVSQTRHKCYSNLGRLSSLSSE